MPADTRQDSPAHRVFISYSTSDRTRVDGLRRLLELFGHEVFMDYLSIRPGRRWRAELQEALEQTDVLLVFWTRAASLSSWVRSECRYVLEHEPERPVVPIIADETPLTAALAERQALTFFPVINELLARKRDLEARGWKRAEIQDDLCKRLREAGIEMEPADRERVFRFFGISGWLTWIASPLVLLGWLGRQLVDAARQLSVAQIALGVGTAGVAAAIASQPALYQADLRSEQVDALTTELAETRQQCDETLALAHTDAVELRHAKVGLENALQIELMWMADVMSELESVSDLAKTKARIDLSSGDAMLTVQFVETESAEHCCTLLLPKNSEFTFFLLPGAYQAYYALGPLSAHLRTLIPEDAVHAVYDTAELDAGDRLPLQVVASDPPPEQVPIYIWGAQRLE